MDKNRNHMVGQNQYGNCNQFCPRHIEKSQPLIQSIYLYLIDKYDFTFSMNFSILIFKGNAILWVEPIQVNHVYFHLFGMDKLSMVSKYLYAYANKIALFIINFMNPKITPYI